MTDINTRAADFVQAKLSKAEIAQRLDRIEAESGRYLRMVLNEWAEKDRSPSVLMAVSARLMAIVMVMFDGTVTEYEMQGGTLGDTEIVEMVTNTARAYAAALREDLGQSAGQRVN